MILERPLTRHKTGQKAGDDMLGSAGTLQPILDDFREVQERMLLAEQEHAEETYAKLKKKYVSLKELLLLLGIHSANLDKIKE